MADNIDNHDKHRKLFADREEAANVARDATSEVMPTSTVTRASISNFGQKLGEKEVAELRSSLNAGESMYHIHVAPSGSFEKGSSSLIVSSEEQGGIGLKELFERNKIKPSDSTRFIIQHVSLSHDNPDMGVVTSNLTPEPVLMEEVKGYKAVDEIINAAHKDKVGVSKGFADSIKRNPNKGWLAVNSVLGAMFLYQAVQGFKQDRQQKIMVAEATGQAKPSVLSSLTMGTLMTGLFSGISFATAGTIIANGRG